MTADELVEARERFECLPACDPICVPGPWGRHDERCPRDLVWDLCDEIEQLQSELAQVLVKGSLSRQLSPTEPID